MSYPTSTSFGNRIQKNNQGCSVKGGCSTAVFTSDRGSSSGNVKSSFEGGHSQSSTESPFIQQEQFAKTDEPTSFNTFEVGKSNNDNSNVGESFPDYEGLISTQDFSKVTESQYPTFEDNVDFSRRNEGIKTKQRPVQSDFHHQVQGTTQNGFSGFTNVQSDINFPVQEKQNVNGPSGSSSSSLDFSGQNADDRYPSNGEQVNYQDNQQPVTQSVFSDSQGSADYQQQMTGQTFGADHQSTDDGQYYHNGNPIDWLKYSVPGNPGEDYPILYQVPPTSFNCQQQQFSAGIFGDTEASCQVCLHFEGNLNAFGFLFSFFNIILSQNFHIRKKKKLNSGASTFYNCRNDKLER